ncbi:MAG: hypothetical protein ACK4FV_06045 [Candidatus Nitrosocaldus sp.]
MKILTCIGKDSKSKEDLIKLFNDTHKLIVIINRLRRYNILRSSIENSICRYSLTQLGRWLLLCYTLRVRPIQLVILALLYNNYHRSITHKLGWIVPLIKYEITRISLDYKVYDEEYAWKQAKTLCKRGLCRYYGKNGIVLEHSTYIMLKQWHDDIYSLYRYVKYIDHYEGQVCI